MKMIKKIVMSFVLFGLCGCTQFTYIPFKYSNLSHMNYRDAMTSVTVKPEELIFDLSEAFRNNGANVLVRKKLGFVWVENPDGQKCWEAKFETDHKEFSSYRANSPSSFYAIDREQPYVSRNITY